MRSYNPKSYKRICFSGMVNQGLLQTRVTSNSLTWKFNFSLHRGVIY